MRRLIGVASLVLALLASSTNEVHAATTPPPTLEGETMTGTGTASSAECPLDGGGTFASRVSGAATGPYPGTFTEQGTFQGPEGVSVTFSITAEDGTTVTGTKQYVEPAYEMRCGLIADILVHGIFLYPALTYTATIPTPTGNYRDEGTSSLSVTYNGVTGIVRLVETFDSSLTQPVLIAPTSKAQCKKGGWKSYPQFKNQGQCVAYVDSLTA